MRDLLNLLKQREQKEINDVAIVRLEQLYPLPHSELESVLSSYADGTPVVWVQEEPTNMGAWMYIKVNFEDAFYDRWPLVDKISRPESASPSTGSKKTHQMEQSELLAAALATSKIKARV